MNSKSVCCVTGNIFGEIQGLIEDTLKENFCGEATLQEVQESTSLTLVDIHHALAEMEKINIVSLKDGTIRLNKFPKNVIKLINSLK